MSGALSGALPSPASRADRPDVSYAVIGAVGVGVHASPRTTLDVDLLLRTSQLALPATLEALGELGQPIDLHAAIQR